MTSQHPDQMVDPTDDPSFDAEVVEEGDEEEQDDTDTHADDPEEASAPEVPDDKTRLSNVRRLLPVHAAPVVGGKSKAGTQLKVQRQRGRPRKVERMATTSDLEYHAVMSEERQAFIDQDPVVMAATQGKAPATQMLKLVRAEIARESASLHFQRIENEKLGKDTSQTSTRRIDALTKIANIELDIAKIGPASIDPYSEEFGKIFASWIAVVQEIAGETLPPEIVDLFFNRLSTALEGWQEKVSETSR